MARRRRRHRRRRRAADQRAARPLHTVSLVRASYDSAQTTTENTRHWRHADQLSPNAAASRDVRTIVRNRARYEVANNSIARGIVLTLANDLIGTGPRLQLQSDDEKLNRRLEQEFARWSAAVRLPAKLRTMRVAKAQDGEAFGMLVTNRGARHEVQLDLRLLEAERIATPNYGLAPATDEQKAVDGIVFDDDGNPAQYHVLSRHPGARDTAFGRMDQYESVPAANMLHWFRADRPEQRRGLPDIMPALPLFALLRRFTLATVTAAETAADFGLVIQTNAPPGGEAAEVDPWVTLELSRNAGIFLPEGWTSAQVEAKHPNSTFPAFRRAIVNEIARCLNMPYNIAAADSAGYNYASGRLDHQTYDRSLDVERSDFAEACLDPLLEQWVNEALRLPSIGGARHLDQITWPHEWMWRGREHVDPAKEATAAKTRLESRTLTLAEEYGRRGLDWREQLRQQIREELTAEKIRQELREELGLPARKAPAKPAKSRSASGSPVPAAANN